MLPVSSSACAEASPQPPRQRHLLESATDTTSSPECWARHLDNSTAWRRAFGASAGIKGQLPCAGSPTPCASSSTRGRLCVSRASATSESISVLLAESVLLQQLESHSLGNLTTSCSSLLQLTRRSWRPTGSPGRPCTALLNNIQVLVKQVCSWPRFCSAAWATSTRKACV